MKHLLITALAALLAFGYAPDATAQSRSKKAKTAASAVSKESKIKSYQTQAQYLMDKGGMDNYKKAYKNITAALKLDSTNALTHGQMAQYYLYRAQYRLDNKYSEEALADYNKALEHVPDLAYYSEYDNLGKQIKASIESIDKDWAAAVAEDTPEALDAFKSAYPRSSHVKEIDARKADFKRWQTVVATNTESAYTDYLAASGIYHEAQAKQAVEGFEMEKEWERIKDSSSYADFDDFVSKYPNSPYLNTAMRNSLMLQADEKYAQEYGHEAAYNLYLLADQIEPLTGERAERYKYVKSEYKYNAVKNIANAKLVAAQLSTLPDDDPFRCQTSDLLANILTDSLTVNSYDSEMNEALSYACSPEVKQGVESRVSSLRAERRKYHRRRWWKQNFKVGILADFELNTSEDAMFDAAEMLNYSVGLGFRIGHHKKIVNGMLGVTYKSFNQVEWGDSGEDTEFENIGSAVAIPFELRLNVGRWDAASLFFGGIGEVGFIVQDKEKVFKKNYFSVGPTFGFCCRHFDMSLYWKSYVGCPYKKDWNGWGELPKMKSHVGLNFRIWF